MVVAVSSGPSRARNFPLNALPESSNLTLLAELTGINRGTLVRWRRHGVPPGRADGLAVAVGRLPGEVWPEFDRPLQQMYGDCGSRAAAVRHKRHGEIPAGKKLIDACEACGVALADYHARRYRERMTDPEFVERERARNRERARRKRAAARVERE